VPVFSPVWPGVRHERLVVAVCDRRLRVVAVRVIADGESDGCSVSMRDLITTVLRHDGHAFAIAHNHPSGDPTPSAADLAITQGCRAVADVCGLRFLGHLVLGDHDTWEQA
jgi:DNA repair protein RadC